MSEKHLYNLSQKLGLSKKDINYSLENETLCLNQNSLSFGPFNYNWGTLYSTYSIYDF